MNHNLAAATLLDPRLKKIAFRSSTRHAEACAGDVITVSSKTA